MLRRRATVELFEAIRREYEFGIGEGKCLVRRHQHVGRSVVLRL